MATIKIELTATDQAITNYAKDLGYSETVVTGVNPDLTYITESNPQSAAEYLTEKVKGIVSNALAEKTIRVIEETKRAEARTAAVDTRIAIEDAMNVTIA